ncbi:hypothetical protein [Gelatiniphilus marinus]|uniref:Uncharacterized protein n=1 Tax=Gelatiniphilus marinus TaxID=1759464 RepID=A0ABW5JR27_9FLAO
MKRKEGIGSYFHLESKPEKNLNLSKKLNLDYTVFYTGRHALLHILNEISASKKISKIWFPNYYCQHTLGWIKHTYKNIETYNTNPFEFSENIEITTFATPNDVVLINNYWGLSTMPQYQTNRPIVIEDHSHGWLSNPCLNSKANYCFVSLRKSLPIPLGGIYWTPNPIVPKINNLFKADENFYKTWDLMQEAMALKTKFINDCKATDNQTFLPKFYEVEEALNHNYTFTKLLKNHGDFIESFLNFDVKKIKQENLGLLYSKIKANPHFKIVKREGYTAFGLLLLFKNKTKYNALKTYLVDNNIYPSSLWPDNNIPYKWQHFLNIHVDFRYTTADMEHIASTLNKWLAINFLED